MTPTINEFDPRHIPFQTQVLRDIRNFDYSKGTHEILLSGSVGSSKSILACHIAALSMIENRGAHVGLGRLSMPALKGTIFKDLTDHVSPLPFKVTDNTAKMEFKPTNSRLTSFSWSDKKYLKFRSHVFNVFIYEEGTENDTDDSYKEIVSRVGRMNHIDQKLIVVCTNPGAPSHWLYERFIGDNNSDRRHVYYSKTKDNPFLPPSYIDDLRRNFSPKEARRMLHGEWIEINEEVIYYEYDRDIHFTDERYEINERFPVWWSHDQNLADGKPMSSVFFQRIGDTFHFFDEIVIQGARTLDVCEEAKDRGLLECNRKIIITGDAAGRARDTRSMGDDYSIIRRFVNNCGSNAEFDVCPPLQNPPIRKRHNTVNAYLKNDLGQHRIKVYGKCKTLDKGFRLTKLRPGASYIEDDSPRAPWQHVTTAAGYGILKALRYNEESSALLPR
jgi:hypothetical protein